ncbi:MAG: hypothetical protein KDJ29_19230 [Hyphomicrobiales bacterium]|nr:hypothetical protein [Hyphomicrobiales bacterium]
MAKVKYTFPSDSSDYPYVDFEDSVITKFGVKSIRYDAPDPSEAHINVKGKGLSVEDDAIVSGQLKKVIFYYDEDSPLISISNVHLNIKKIGPIDDYADLISSALSGNDKVIGSKFADFMFGGAGKNTLDGKGGDDVLGSFGGVDKMKGGVGSDTFVFNEGTTKMLVMDFDASPDDGGQDYLWGWFDTEVMPDIDIYSSQSGKDTVVEFVGYGKIIVKGVDVDLITMDDFKDPGLL